MVKETLNLREPCPVCENPDTSIIWSKPNFELYQFPFGDRDEVRSYRMDQIIHFCGQCHHGFLCPTPDDPTLNAFYESGYSGYTSTLETGGLGSTMNDPACDYIEAEINRRFSGKVRIAEIGGNDGYVSVQLEHLAKQRLLIEPSQSAASIARRHGVPVLETFLSDEIADQYSAQFDVVVSRYVLEHVRDPAAFIRQLSILLAPGGILVLEQPDLPRILDSLLVKVLILIHLNHFSPNSLHRLVTQKCGLTISEIGFLPSGFIVSLTKENAANTITTQNCLRSIDTASIILTNAATFSDKLAAHISKLTAIISRWKDSGKLIWVWGAGTTGGDLFNVYGQQFELFQGYIDSDQRKVGMSYATAPDLPICSPASAYEQGVDAILIATFSVGEVLQTISQLGWQVEAAALHTAELSPLVANNV